MLERERALPLLQMSMATGDPVDTKLRSLRLLWTAAALWPEWELFVLAILVLPCRERRVRAMAAAAANAAGETLSQAALSPS
jgi:hypothetical protein